MWHMALPFSPTLGVALRAAQDHRHFLAFGSIPSRVCGPAWIEDEQRRSVARRSLNYTPRFAAEGRNEHVRLHRVKRGPGPRCWRRRWNKERGNLGGSIGSHHAAVPAHADERPRARPEPLRAGADGGGMGDAFERGVYGDIAPGPPGPGPPAAGGHAARDGAHEHARGARDAPGGVPPGPAGRSGHTRLREPRAGGGRRAAADGRRRRRGGPRGGGAGPVIPRGRLRHGVGGRRCGSVGGRCHWAALHACPVAVGASVAVQPRVARRPQHAGGRDHTARARTGRHTGAEP